MEEALGLRPTAPGIGAVRRRRAKVNDKYWSPLSAAVGLPFKEIVQAEQLPWSALAGRSVAVDGYNAIYQFLATVRQADGEPFSDARGRPTSHLMGVFYRTTSLLGEGVRPVWVFDGRPPDLKAGTLRARFHAKERAEEQRQEALAAGDMETARRKAAQTSRLTPSMAEEAIGLLAALGIPTVRAPSEGEAQAARMAAAGAVWACASEDYDGLLFGAPRLVRGLAARRSKGVDAGAQLIDRDRLLATLGIDGDELILIGILVGTDFNEGAVGYGPKKALKLVKEHLGWEATVGRAGLDPKEVADVAEIFRRPDTIDTPVPEFGPIDDEAVLRSLVDDHGFSEERVRSAIDRARRGSRIVPRPAPAVATRGRQTLLDGFGGTAA
ncbi:MAG: flap structure-specific endonuclease [Thermoplasmata archaeon]